MKKLIITAMICCIGLGLALAKDKAAKPIDAKTGNEFSITLDSNPTTGYRWQLAKPLDESLVKLVGNEYQEPESSGAVGAGGKEIWTFKAVAEGKTAIAMKYVRSWEKNQPPAKRAKFEVVIRKDDSEKKGND